MKAEWSQQARRDLIGVFQHVARDNPSAARSLLRRIRDSEQLVLAHPLLGRVVPEFQVAHLRERIVPPYRVLYQVERDAVVFLTVVHSRQDLGRFVQTDEER